MDLITDQFMRKTPVRLLEKYRHHMRKVVHVIWKSLADPVPFLLSPTNTEWSDDFLIVTGSMAEGASLARLFSPYNDTAREMECDMMTTFLAFNVEEDMLHYIPNNKVFAHIKADLSILTKVSDDVSQTVKSLLSWKEDGLYWNGTSVMKWFKEVMELMPNLLNNAGFRTSITEKICEASSAAINITIKYANDEADETAACANAKAQQSSLVQQIRQYYDSVEANIGQMLNRLKLLGEEFVKMRSGEVSAALRDQVAKALKWSMHCIDVTDLIFDVAENTICRGCREAGGIDLSLECEGQRGTIKSKLQNFVDELVMAEDDISRQSVARVRQTLSDMDFRVPRFLYGLQEISRQNSMYVKLLNFADQSPQMNCVPQPLQELSSCLSRLSIDIVPCVKLMFWPSVAAEWKTRDRLWPHQSVIDDIVAKGAHVVGKAFCHDDIDWRLSFSIAEIELATRWCPVQHFVYFIFKALFYKFIKPLSIDLTAAELSARESSRKYIASYTAKTVMMWTSESVDQSWWTEDNAAECLTVLLLALQSAFECRTLEHYFVSSLNLLEGLPDVLASRVIDTIKSILDDPADVVYQLESHFVNTHIFFNAMHEQAKQARIVPFLMNLLKYNILNVHTD